MKSRHLTHFRQLWKSHCNKQFKSLVIWVILCCNAIFLVNVLLIRPQQIQTNIDAWYAVLFWGLREIAWLICVTVVDWGGQPRYSEWNVWPPERMISMNMKCDFDLVQFFLVTILLFTWSMQKMYKMPVVWMDEERNHIYYVLYAALNISPQFIVLG